MTRLRFKGPRAGTGFDLADATVATDSGGVAVAAWLTPAAVAGLPLIRNAAAPGRQRDGDTLSLLTGGLSGITGYRWTSNGADIAGATAATHVLDDAANGTTDTWIACEVTCDQGILTTPAVLVYAPMASPHHDADDDALLALVPHEDVTHVAVADGGWSSPATWAGGAVPHYGAVVLIPRGRVVTYDVAAAAARLDRVRVDGELTWATDRSTRMRVETLAGTRGSVLRIATPASRLPAAHRAEIVISDRDYRTDSRAPTDIDFARDPRVIGRGVLWQGTMSIWGAGKTGWLRSAPGAAPMAGDTTVTLERAPTGWQVGDTIAIGGTGFSDPLGGSQTETRTITSIIGAVVGWSGGLIHDHDHQAPGVVRHDLQPGIGNLTRNVCIRSENAEVPVWRRGHTMAMHMRSQTDVWSCEFRDLGRTQKGDTTPAGINENGSFKYWDAAVFAFATAPLTARSNLQSRYPCHFHHVGFAKAARDVFDGCAVSGSPGWAMVHHGCDADLVGNVMYEFTGAGMVSESGNETGLWVNNLALKSLNKSAATPKNAEDADGRERGTRGDFFRTGYGFAMRGRAMRTNRNFAMDVSWGHVFFHREYTPSLSASIFHKRSQIDLKDLQGVAAAYDMNPRDYPIVHFADNEAAGTWGGLFVTKPGPAQNHGLNINLKRLKSWGFRTAGGWVEYIGQYALTGWDCVAGATGGIGIQMGANAYGVAAVRCRTTACSIGIRCRADDIAGHAPVLSPAGEARFMIEAHESVGDATAIVDDNVPGELQTLAAEQSYVEAATDLPFIVADWDGTGGFGTGVTNIAQGTLSDTLNGAGILPKPWDGTGIPTMYDSAACGAFAAAAGYHTSAGSNVLVFPLYVSDRLSARPVIEYHAVRCTGSVAGYASNGAYTLSASAPAVSAAVLSTAPGTPGTLDILALASDPDGGTLALRDSFYNPDHGRLEVNQPVPGSVRYTPDPGYAGTDLAFVWIEDGAGHATRVDLDIRVGVSGAGAIAPAGWSLSQAAGDAFTVTLGAPPDSGRRRIAKVEYSTDGGAAWARLCYGWIPGPHVADRDSAGAALAPGQVLADLRLRYVTDLGDTPGSDIKSITLD